MDANEQATAEIMARIANAPTRADKVTALLEALDWMRSIPVDTTGAQPGAMRARRIFDVTAVGQFLRALGRVDLARDFHALASALSDADLGIEREMLKPAARKGGPTPRGSDVWRARAYVAAAVDVLLRAGQPLKIIKSELDCRRELRPLLDKRKRGGGSLGNAAEGWREQFNSGAVNNFEAVGTYSNCQDIAASPTTDLNQQVEWLLYMAAETVSDSS